MSFPVNTQLSGSVLRFYQEGTPTVTGSVSLEVPTRYLGKPTFPSDAEYSDNGGGARATLYRRASLTGGRAWSEGFQYYLKKNYGNTSNREVIATLSNNNLTDPSDTTYPKTMAAMALLYDEIFFTSADDSNGTRGGALYSYNINDGTLTYWTTLSAAGNADYPSGGSIQAANASDIIAHTDWLGAQFIAAVTPNGFFNMEIYRTANSFYSRIAPVTPNGFLGGRIAVSHRGQNSGVKQGQIYVSAPNENSIYLFDWNDNTTITIIQTATIFGVDSDPTTHPTAMAVDGAENLWVCDHTNNRVLILAPDPNANNLTLLDIVYVDDPRDVCFDGHNMWIMSAASSAFYRVNPRTKEVTGKVQHNGQDTYFAPLYSGPIGKPWTRMFWDGETMYFVQGTGDVGHFDPASCTYLGTPDFGPDTNAVVPISPGFFAFRGGGKLKFGATNANGNITANSIAWLDRPLDAHLGGRLTNEVTIELARMYKSITQDDSSNPIVIGFGRLLHPSANGTQVLSPKPRGGRKVYFRREGHLTTSGGAGPAVLTLRLYDRNGVTNAGTPTYIASATRSFSFVGGTAGGTVMYAEDEIPELETWLNSSVPSQTIGMFEVHAHVGYHANPGECYMAELAIVWS